MTVAGGTAGIEGDMRHGLNTRLDDGSASDRTRTAESTGQQIPVIQETMQVDKRQVQRGGRRVYGRVSERPVQESVQLRAERAHIERRPTDRPATDADLAAMKDMSIAVQETEEELVVSRQARVVEEVQIGTEVAQLTEKLRGTVKKTDVEVERLGDERHATAAKPRRDSSSIDPSAAGSSATAGLEDSVPDRAKAAAERGADKLSGTRDHTSTPRKSSRTDRRCHVGGGPSIHPR